MRKSIAFALTLALSLAGTAQAAPNNQATDEARERFQRGVALYREGSYDAALAEFQRAYEVQPNYRVLYNLAQVQLERHDTVAALKLFREYLSSGGNEIDAERRAQVEKDLRMLESRVAELRVEVNEPGASLTVDDELVESWQAATPLLVNSGVHRLTVSKAGFRTQLQTITVPGGVPFSIRFTLVPDVQAPAGALPATRPERARSEGHALGLPFWISLSATAAFAAGAGTFVVLTRNADEELDREFERFPGDAGDVSDARDRLKRNALLADALGGAALVAAGFTVYFAFSGSSSATSRTGAAQPLALRARVGASRLLLEGQF